MLPTRHLVLSTLLVVLLARLPAQLVVAAFRITRASCVTLSPAPPPSVQPVISEAGTPIIFPEVLGGKVISLARLPVDHNGSTVVAAPTILGNTVNPALISTTLSKNTVFNSY